MNNFIPMTNTLSPSEEKGHFQNGFSSVFKVGLPGKQLKNPEVGIYCSTFSDLLLR